MARGRTAPLSLSEDMFHLVSSGTALPCLLSVLWSRHSCVSMKEKPNPQHEADHVPWLKDPSWKLWTVWRGVLQNWAPPWPLKWLNYPSTSWNLTGVSALQERKREKREWCSGAMCISFSISAQPGPVTLWEYAAVPSFRQKKKKKMKSYWKLGRADEALKNSQTEKLS